MIHRLWWWTGKFAGPRLRVGLARGETQEEHVWNLILRRSDVDDHGASRHPISTRSIQSSSTSGSRIWTCRCSASYQQSRDRSSSEGDSESYRRERSATSERRDRKEFTGREEGFQQWSKKTEAFFAGVIKESDMVLEWAAEQPTKITMTSIDFEILPTDANKDRGVQNLEFVLQQIAHSTHRL